MTYFSAKLPSCVHPRPQGCCKLFLAWKPIHLPFLILFLEKAPLLAVWAPPPRILTALSASPCSLGRVLFSGPSAALYWNPWPNTLSSPARNQAPVWARSSLSSSARKTGQVSGALRPEDSWAKRQGVQRESETFVSTVGETSSSVTKRWVEFLWAPRPSSQTPRSSHRTQSTDWHCWSSLQLHEGYLWASTLPWKMGSLTIQVSKGLGISNSQPDRSLARISSVQQCFSSARYILSSELPIYKINGSINLL